MKKILIVLITLILTSCSNSSRVDVSENRINIFNLKEDIEYVLDEKIYLNNILHEEYNESALIYGNGFVEKVRLNNEEGNLFLNINDFKDLQGIYLYNDFHSITDAYYDTKKLLDENEKVITVLLDGFSLSQYIYAKDMGYINFLNKYFKNEALSVYTPVTNAGYAAIITGKTPDINGIHDRSFREMKVDSIFQYSIDTSKKSTLLEGDIKILNTEIEPQLHIDLNNDGDTDDEMFESTLKVAEENYDFIFVHFHGIDDRGHSYGPYSNETMEYIKKVDGYINDLSKQWTGKIILTADHGMHETEEGGDHGQCRMSDMVVPYFIIQ